MNHIVILEYLAVWVYFMVAGYLMLYGMNCYVMVFLFKRRQKRAAEKRQALLRQYKNITERADLPVVTTQIPVFNELNVIERAIDAVCRMTYPADKHEIQILDDSTDETREIIDTLVAAYRKQGVNIQAIRRENRTGFKAGALSYGMQTAKGSLFAIFDADFVPPADFLLQTIPHFLHDSSIGLVQARWGHINRNHSILTRAQSIGIDGHFMVEQSGRAWNNLYMNFNGTAGIWRKQAILDGGGWQWDTLTEDMDLSYRVQFKGWQTVYALDVIVPAEIPEDVSAFKSQQFRWAKGSIQTAKKLLPQIVSAPIPRFKKLQAFFHLTHYMVHPMMLTLALLALPVLVSLKTVPGPWVVGVLAIMLAIAMFAPSTLYLVSQKAAYPDWVRRSVILPFLVVVGVGIAVSNTRAVFEALLGIKSDFIRTPKRGASIRKLYKIHLPGSALFEILIGLYCAWSLGYYLIAGKYLIGPFLAAYAAGFLFIGILTIVHGLRGAG